jgi:hypothetical protein
MKIVSCFADKFTISPAGALNERRHEGFLEGLYLKRTLSEIVKWK